MILEVGDISKVCINPEAKEISIENFIRSQEIEVVFPILHGTGGEDGLIQGLLSKLHILIWLM